MANCLFAINKKGYKKRTMKRKGFIKSVSVVAIMAFVIAVLAGCACSTSSQKATYKVVNSGKLTVASSLDFPPLESSENGNPVGFDIAVIQEVAKRLGLECEIRDTKFDDIIPTIADGSQCDVGISALSINSERGKLVDFSDSYYISDLAVVVAKGSYASESELKGKSVVAMTDSTALDYAKKISEASTGCETAAECFASVQAKKSQALVVDYPVAKTMIASSYSGLEILEKVATGEKYGIAVNKDNTALKDAINEVLKEMEKDGTLKNLEDQYFK